MSDSLSSASLLLPRDDGFKLECSFDFPNSGITVLFGASGSGKLRFFAVSQDWSGHEVSSRLTEFIGKTMHKSFSTDLGASIRICVPGGIALSAHDR